MRRELVAVAVVLPVLAIGVAIASAELQGARSREFVFRIGGYDPRDLLKGRYLQFRLRVDPDAKLEACDSLVRDDCCVCLTRNGPDEPASTATATCATARAQCDGALPSRQAGRMLRYYVAEADAARLDQELAEAMQQDRATAVIALEPDGSIQVRELRLYGVAVPGAPPR